MGSNLIRVVFKNRCRLTSINSSVFFGCPFLTSVKFHSNLMGLSNDAFYHCSSLSKIKFSRKSRNVTIGNSCFSKCNFEVLEINNSIGYIKSNAFSNCPNLREIRFNYLPLVDGSVFFECSNVIKITISNINDFKKQYFDLMFSDVRKNIKEVVSLPDSNPESLFSNCNNLESAAIYESVISASLFENCTSLKTVRFNMDGITVNERAFYNCINLDRRILKNISSIGNLAFYRCRFFHSLIIPDKIKHIGSKAFHETGIKNIHYCSIGFSCSEDAFDSGSKAYVTDEFGDSKLCELETSKINKSACNIIRPTSFDLVPLRVAHFRRR